MMVEKTIKTNVHAETVLYIIISYFLEYLSIKVVMILTFIHNILIEKKP